MKNKIFYILIFLLPFQIRYFFKIGMINNGFSEYNTISFYLSDLLLFFLFILFIQKLFKNKNKTKLLIDKNILFSLAGLELFIFISCLFASQKSIAFYFYFKFLISLFLFLFIYKSKISFSKIIYTLAGSSFLISCFAIWQWFSKSSPACKWLGIAAHNTAAGQSVIQNMEGERFLRAYGVFDHPNILGAFLSIIILFTIIELYKNKNLKYKNFLTISIIFNLIALFFSFSRAAWISLFLGLFFLILIAIFKKKFGEKKLFFLKTAFLLFIPLFILSCFYHELLQIRIFGKTNLENISNTERLDYIEHSYQIIKNNFFIGVGAGNYPNHLSLMIENKPSYFYQPVHNVFLLIWAEIGIIGLIFFIIFLIHTFITIKKSNPIYLSIFFAFFPLLLFDHWLWSLHFGIIFFYFCFSLLYKKSYIKQNQNKT